MRTSLRLTVVASITAGAVAFLGAVLLSQPLLAISLVPGDSGVWLWLGVGFWTLLALAATAMPVRVPQGASLDVSFGPVVAAMSLGGPAAAAWIAAIGSTQMRELRGEVAWYKAAANHASIVLPSIGGALMMTAFPGRQESVVVDFLATTAGGAFAFTTNLVIAATFVALSTGMRLDHVLRKDAGAYLNELTLAPLAWLMAVMYMRAGWWSVLLFAVPLYTTRLAYQRFVEIRQMFTQTVRSLAEAVDKRDKYTSGHSHRVQEIAIDIGRVMKVKDDELEALEWGGLLHDIGKIGVPDSVLLKQERLTRDERSVMNSHPVLGAEIIAPVERLAPELPIIRHHHEWFNGSGYPDRLVADQIPMLARILHVADAFEAMTAVRPYRMTPLTTDQAVGELRKFGGIQFDPDVVDAFVQTKWAHAEASATSGVRDVPLIAHAAHSLSPSRILDKGGAPAPAEQATVTSPPVVS